MYRYLLNIVFVPTVFFIWACIQIDEQLKTQCLACSKSLSDHNHDFVIIIYIYIHTPIN